MSDPIVIWIIDDLKNDAKLAWEVVEKLLPRFMEKSMAMNPVILWSDGFEWPPFGNFRELVDPNAPNLYRTDYPDIVILDLLRQGALGDKFEGDTFYYGLRDWEKPKPGRHSFVILWSPYQGQKDAQDFIGQVRKNDQRLIPLPTKSGSELGTVLEALMERIVEEEG